MLILKQRPYRQVRGPNQLHQFQMGWLSFFVTGYAYSGSFIPTAQSQTTAISNAGYNSDIYAAGYKTTTGTSVTVGIDRSTSGQYFSVDGITLRPASGGAGATTVTSTTGLNALYKNWHHCNINSGALLQKSFSGTVSLDAPAAALKSGNVSIDAL